MKTNKVEILIGIISLIVAILVWLFPPDPLQKLLGIGDDDARDIRQTETPISIPTFTGTVHEDDFQALNNNGSPEFMDFIENNVDQTVYLDVEVGSEQMRTLNEYVVEGNSKLYVLVVAHPTLNYWFEIKMIVEPSDNFFFGPISTEYGQLRGHFKIMGRYGIGTAVSGFELQAIPAPE